MLLPDNGSVVATAVAVAPGSAPHFVAQAMVERESSPPRPA